MLQYTGKLYGRIGRKHIDTGKTGAEWDAMEAEIKRLKKGMECAANPADRIAEIRSQIDALNVELAQLTGLVCEDVDLTIRNLLKAGNKIGAVKTYRMAMGPSCSPCSLKDAIAYVNAIEAQIQREP